MSGLSKDFFSTYIVARYEEKPITSLRRRKDNKRLCREKKPVRVLPDEEKPVSLVSDEKSQFAPSSGEKLQQTTFRARNKIEIY